MRTNCVSWKIQRKCCSSDTIRHVFKSETWFLLLQSSHWVCVTSLQVKRCPLVRFSCIHCHCSRCDSHHMSFAEMMAQQQCTYLSLSWSSLPDGNGWTTKCSDEDDIISVYLNVQGSHIKPEIYMQTAIRLPPNYLEFSVPLPKIDFN